MKMNKEQMLKRLAMNIVSQLFDLADVPVEKRQAINDEADDFVLRLLQQCNVGGSLPPDWSIKNILHSVYADALNKWSSHDEVDAGLNEYVTAIKNRITGGNDR